MLRLAPRQTTAAIPEAPSPEPEVVQASVTIPAPDPSSIPNADKVRAATWYVDKDLYRLRFSCPEDRFPHATSVSVAFYFEHWDSSLHPMRRGPNGTWDAFIDLPRGTYMYRLVVDGYFFLDPQAPVQTLGPDGNATSLTWVNPPPPEVF